MPTTSPAGSTMRRSCHGSKPGRFTTLARPLLEGRALALRPLEERVLVDRPGRLEVSLVTAARGWRSRRGSAAARSSGRPASRAPTTSTSAGSPVRRRAARRRSHRAPAGRRWCRRRAHRRRGSSATERSRCRGPGMRGRPPRRPSAPCRPRRTRRGARRRGRPTVWVGRSNAGRCQSPTMSASSMSTSPTSCCSHVAMRAVTAAASSRVSGRTVSASEAAGSARATAATEPAVVS